MTVTHLAFFKERMLLFIKTAILGLFADKTADINLYFGLFIFIFGVVGNILNILILNQRTFRSNACIYLFRASSIANLISIFFGLTPRILSRWKLDFTATHDIPCKFRAFITFSSRTIALWLIMFATADRYFTSSNHIHLRKLSTLKNAQTNSIIITCLSILVYSQMLFCYQANLSSTPLKCYGKTDICCLITDLTYSCLAIMFPLIFMTVFGLLTISNLRQRRYCLQGRKYSHERHVNRKTLISLDQQRQRWKKLERYLQHMLCLQVISLIILTLPQVIHKLYFTLTYRWDKSTIEYELNRILYQFELLLPYLENALPFYIYTLAGGKIFRRAFQKLVYSFR